MMGVTFNGDNAGNGNLTAHISDWRAQAIENRKADALEAAAIRQQLAAMETARTERLAAQAEQERVQAILAADEQQAIVDQQAVRSSQAAPAASGDDGSAKMFIYMHESGNDPKARNSSGCLGLGQACPGSKLLAVCPNLDYACEDAFFTDYMAGRYGSWEAARSFWLANNYW